MTVKLRHPTLTNCNFNVVLPQRYQAPYACPACNEIHLFKTFHLRLDSSGEVEVTDGIYDRLAELDGLPLTKAGKVSKPTPQRIEMPALGQPGQVIRPSKELFVPKSLQEEVRKTNEDFRKANGGQ